MAKKNLFLVSFILDNQPQSREIESDAETLTPDQALAALRENNPDLATGNVTDVQVQHMVEPKEKGTTPSHHVQP